MVWFPKAPTSESSTGTNGSRLIASLDKGSGHVAWIDVIPEPNAEGELARVYERIAGTRGKVSNIMRVQSLDPAAMEAHLELYLKILFGRGGLSRARRELLAVVVSAMNGCRYCVLHHAAALEAWWKDQERVQRLLSILGWVDGGPGEDGSRAEQPEPWKAPDGMAASDLARVAAEAAALEPADEPLLRYAIGLTLEPGGMTRADVEAVREAGFSDREILQANMIVGYFNFVNRIAVGLGAEAPLEEVGGYEY